MWKFRHTNLIKHTAMSWIWIPAIFVVFVLYFLEHLQNLFKNKKQPPGPIRLPIIGHFHLLGKTPHRDLHRLAKKYGPIMSMRFGSIPTVIVSSPAAAELFLKAHDLVFANRPHHESASYLGQEQAGVVFAPYGPHWRNMRKLCTLELLSNLRVAQFQPMREREIGLLIDVLRRASDRRGVVDMSARIASLSVDTTCLMVLGKKYDDGCLGGKGFKELMKEAMEVAAAFDLGDCFPYLRWLDLHGSTKRLKNVSNIFDEFLERVIEEHVHEKAEKEKGMADFVDTLMTILDSGAEFDFDRRQVKVVLLGMLLAQMDSSAAAMEWTLSEIMKNPEVKRRLQDELFDKVGMDRTVEEWHLPKLKYLDFVVRESLRLHPPSTMLIHESTEDCEVNGCHIPKKTQVLVNVWAIGRDPDVWSDPETFLPAERFVKNNVDVRGQDFQLIPFGAGRRICPGIQLGLTMVKLVIAQLVHCFDWKLPHGMMPQDLDMDETAGLVSSRANPLMAIPIYRLHK